MFNPQATKPPKIERVSQRDWMKGVIHAQDDGRTPQDGLRDAGNLIIEQDGVIRPRPPLLKYGPEAAGTILGEVFEFARFDNGVREYWLATVQNVSGTTKVYVCQPDIDTSWTACDGKEYDNDAAAHFVQIDDKILVMNGVDNLSYLDTSDFSITAFVELDTPGTLSGTVQSGITGTNFNVYYAVTANSTVGETDPSDTLTKTVSKDRDTWDNDTNYVEVSWPALSGAQSYNVYMGTAADGAGDPTLYAIATGLDAGTTTFRDTGIRAQDLSRPAPTANSTAGPKATRGCVSNGRVFLVGDADDPFKVWRGGDYGFLLDFSPSNGGGFTPVGYGTKDVPVAIKSFRNGKGDAMVMILQQGTNGTGKRSYLNPTTITYGSSSFVVWQATEDSGQDGTDSPDGVIIYNNSVWYPSKDGFKTTGTKPQLQNILSTDKISNTIQTDIPLLNSDAMDKAVGLAYENRLYWALPVSSDRNSQIWVLDLERKGAWMTNWNIHADWMTLYNDNSGRTHFLILKNNRIYELTYAAKTADDGSAVLTRGQSGQIRFSEDGREWGRLTKVTFEVLRPQGEINFTVTAKTEDGLLPFSHTETFGASTTRTGWSEPKAQWSVPKRPWSGVLGVPKSFNEATQEISVEVDEDAQWYSYGWNTTRSGVDYVLSNVVSEYVNIGIKDIT